MLTGHCSHELIPKLSIAMTMFRWPCSMARSAKVTSGLSGTCRNGVGAAGRRGSSRTWVRDEESPSSRTHSGLLG